MSSAECFGVEAMSSHAEKKAAREYAAGHGINYQKALTALRDKATAGAGHPVAGSGHLRPGQDSLEVQVNICERQADGSLLYGEYVQEDWLASHFAGVHSWAITLTLIDAIPHLAEAIAVRLRSEVSVEFAEAVDMYGDLEVIGSPPHPDELSNRELLKRWLSHDLEDEVYSADDLMESLGNPDQFEEPMAPEYANPFQACAVREFAGLSGDCGGSLSVETILPADTPLDEKTLHSRLVGQVPDWDRFLDLIGPWHLVRSADVLSA